jgi:hypothetical protein
VRQALGARRREILVQFLIEAAVLTSVGGILGVLMGSAIGLLVNLISGFPVSCPWWSSPLGLDSGWNRHLLRECCRLARSRSTQSKLCDTNIRKSEI